jgi:hypothetical protein
MRTQRIKKAYWKGVLVGAAIAATIVSLGYKVKVANIEEENHMVHEYVACLQDNHTQRDYCARKQGASYYYMDQLVEKYGYEYTQVGKDLFIDYKGGE